MTPTTAPTRPATPTSLPTKPTPDKLVSDLLLDGVYAPYIRSYGSFASASTRTTISTSPPTKPTTAPPTRPTPPASPHVGVFNG